MATIRSYTSLEQSKRLAEILPLEIADMYYEWPNKKVHFKDDKYNGMGFSCWSLAALLGVLPMITKGKENANPFIAKTPDNEYYVVYATLTEEVDSSAIYNNPIDACVEMIIHLHELNLL